MTSIPKISLWRLSCAIASMCALAYGNLNGSYEVTQHRSKSERSSVLAPPSTIITHALQRRRWARRAKGLEVEDALIAKRSLPYKRLPEEHVLTAEERSHCSADFFRCNAAFRSQALEEPEAKARMSRAERMLVDACPYSEKAASPSRFVVAHGFDGLSDSLAGAVTAFYIALLTGSQLVLQYDDGDITWTSAFREHSIRFHAPKVANSTNRHNTTYVKIHAFDRAVRRGSKLVHAFRHGKLDSLFEGKPVLDLRTNMGITHLFPRSPYLPILKALGVGPSSSFGCAQSWLMRPLGLGEAHNLKSLELALNPATLTIGIHLRTGARSNDVFANQLSTLRRKTHFYDSWWSCAEGVERLLRRQHGDGKKVMWLLYSDSISIRRKVFKRFGAKVITCVSNDCVPEHTRGALLGSERHRIENATSTVQGMRLAATEQSLLSLGDAFLISESSGYGRNSAVLRNAKMGERPVFALNPRNPVEIGPCDNPSRSLNYTTISTIPGYL